MARPPKQLRALTEAEHEAIAEQLKIMRAAAWKMVGIFEQAYPYGSQRQGAVSVALINNSACDRMQELYRLERGRPADPGLPVDDASRLYLTPQELADQIRDAGLPDPDRPL